jgi:SAM-dependent methyltransferase
MSATSLYKRRPITDGYPDMEERYVANKKNVLEARQALEARMGGLGDILTCMDRLIALGAGPKTVAVVGCGPSPETVAQLISRGYQAVGIEPVDASLEAARRYLGGHEHVLQGTAEHMPFADHSQRMVLMENVLEHVDSPRQSLAEMYRVLMPGGVLFVRTTNRTRISIRGRNWEFNVPFYNWLPQSVRESYVFLQQHYLPSLADFSPRPAVHWFTFVDLCARGRDVGFAKFYAPSDLLTLYRGDKDVSLGKRLMAYLRRNPWLRAGNLAWTQMGNDIYMWKRK